MRSVVVGAAALLCCSALAEDCRVETGGARVVSGEKTYGAIVCDGSLTIADGAVVTCSSFVIGSAAGKSGSVEIGNNVSLTVTGSGYDSFVVGYDSASASLSVGTNSTINCGPYFYARKFTSSGASAISAGTSLIDSSSQVSVHLKDGASIVGSGNDPVVYFSGGTKLSSTAPAKYIGNTVRLDSGARLNFACFSPAGRPHSRVVFNGGQLRQGIWNNARTSALFASLAWYDSVADAKMYLTGTNGNDIVIYKDQWSTALFASTGGAGSFVFNGDGDVVFRGGRANAWLLNGRWCALAAQKDFIVDLVNFNGKAVRFDGIVTLTATDKPRAETGATPVSRLQDWLSRFASLSTGPNVSLDLYGYNLSAKRLNAEGLIFSSTDPGRPVVTFGGGNGSCMLGNPGTNVVFKKVGTGALVVSNAMDVAELNVTTGAVTFAATAAAGATATFGRLELGKDVTLTQGSGRALAVRELSIDASSSASVDLFCPAANGRLDVVNADFDSYPRLLPFAARATSHRDNLRTWTLYVNGAIRGDVGSADPRIGIAKGHLALGTFGLMLMFR